MNVHVCDVATLYDMLSPTVSGIIRRQKKQFKTVKIQGGPLKLSERGKRAFKKCLLENCLQSLHAVVALLKVTLV